MTTEQGDKEEATQDPRPEAVGSATKERSGYHMPECMTTYKVFRKGILSSHRIVFSHDCGMIEEWVQEELPW